MIDLDTMTKQDMSGEGKIRIKVSDVKGKNRYQLFASLMFAIRFMHVFTLAVSENLCFLCMLILFIIHAGR